MNIWIKQGVMGDLCIELRKALGRVQLLYMSKRVEDFYITSKREGNHMMGSLHYDGRAVDFRNRGISLEDVRAAVGKGFDVVPFSVAGEGSPGTGVSYTHYHLEYDPK